MGSIRGLNYMYMRNVRIALLFQESYQAAFCFSLQYRVFYFQH